MQAFKLGFFLNVFASMLFYFGLYLYFNHTDMGLQGFELYRAELMEILEASRKLDPERMTQQFYMETKQNTEALTPSDMFWNREILIFHLFGLFSTLMMGLIFRHDPK